MATAIAPSRARRTIRVARVKKEHGIRNYRSALSYLDSLTNFERMPRVGRIDWAGALSRMQRLLALLGNPHKRLRTVHIAGTKGKGSTVAMLAGMLSANRITVGAYTSPHIMDVRERIAINGRMISEIEFARAIDRVAAAAQSLRNGQPTYFEALTAAAFLYYADKEVDLAIIETGLGGRFDSTNVLVKPEVCGITSISFDHMDQLGNTLALIAEEKAGIFKPGVPVISAPQTAEVKRVLRRVAEKVKAPLKFAGEDIEFSTRFERSRAAGPHTRISIATPGSRFEHLAVPLPGEHQAVNCGLALGLLDVLKASGFEVEEEAAIAGLSSVELPGRMETVCESPHVIVDGAHNAASIDALMRAIGQNVPYDSMVVVFGCNNDKDIPGMMHCLQLGADKIIFTQSSSPRAAEPPALAAKFTEVSGRMAQVAPTLEEALHVASKAVSRDDLICVAGSFHLVADAKRLFARPDFASQLVG